MKRVTAVMAALIIMGLANLAGAAVTFNFGGTIQYDTDVVHKSFSLANNVANVQIFTDSYNNGANFNAGLDLWKGIGDSAVLLAENLGVDASGNLAEAVITLPDLAAGDYMITVLASFNGAMAAIDSSNPTLGAGFVLDGTEPTAIENAFFGGPGFYHVNFAASEAAPVPIPPALFLFGSGIFGIGALRRRSIG